MRRPDEISLMSAIKKNIYPYRPLCSRHFALKIITLAHILISIVMAKLRTPNM